LFNDGSYLFEHVGVGRDRLLLLAEDGLIHSFLFLDLLLHSWTTGLLLNLWLDRRDLLLLLLLRGRLLHFNLRLSSGDDLIIFSGKVLRGLVRNGLLSLVLIEGCLAVGWSSS